jgi:hypothetical protein
MAGIAYASFQTKADAKADMKYISETYMTKELSQERWKNNDDAHKMLELKLDEILKELRRKNK